LQRDWRTYKNSTILADAHSHLLTLDAAFKTGRQQYVLDSFLFRFFAQGVKHEICI